ncbi:MAG: hypothetical protein ACR2K6_08355 [Solirubrobacterales bacterium]
MLEEGRIARRRLLLDQLDFYFRPPAWFYEEIEVAIDLASRGREDEQTELEGRRYPVRELIDHYALDELVGLTRKSRDLDCDGCMQFGCEQCESLRYGE